MHLFIHGRTLLGKSFQILSGMKPFVGYCTLLAIFAFMPSFQRHPQTHTFSHILPRRSSWRFFPWMNPPSQVSGCCGHKPFHARKPFLCWPILPARALFWMKFAGDLSDAFSCMKALFCNTCAKSCYDASYVLN